MSQESPPKTEAALEADEVIMQEEKRSLFLAGVYNLAMAGIGAITVAQEEIESFVQKTGERSRVTEEDSRGLLVEVKAKRKARIKKVTKKLDEQMDNALARLNIPTKSDVDNLNVKIADLFKKLDELELE